MKKIVKTILKILYGALKNGILYIATAIFIALLIVAILIFYSNIFDFVKLIK